MPENITAICPECLTQYSLKPDVVGKRMRCTEESCGTVFTVTPVESNGVVAAVEAVAERAVSSPATPTPIEMEDWQTEPPPIRQDGDSDQLEPPPVRTTAATLPAYLAPRPQRSRRRWIAIGLTLFTIGMAAWGGITVVRNLAQAEERMAEDADKSYSDGKFGDAAQRYRSLVEKYPHGIRSGEYRFLASLAEVRRLAGAAPPEPETALQTLNSFFTDHGGSAYLTNRRQEVHDTAQKIFDDLVREGTESIGGRTPNLGAAETQQQQAKQAFLLMERNAPPGVDVASARQKLDSLTRAIEQARAITAVRNEIIALLNRPRPDLEAARDLIRRSGLTNDTEVTSAWQRAEESLRKLVTYQASVQPAQKVAPTSGPPGILPEPRGSAAAGPRVPASADGLLYALEARTGRLAWVERLGIDATWLPQRLAGEDRDDYWLVVSTEPLGLSVRKSSDGTLVWFQPLESQPLGPPIIVQRRVFIAMPGPLGRVMEFDALNGQLKGYFEIGQPLAAGLAVAPGTSRLYAPALGQQVFILDFGGDDVGLPPRCVGTLNTGHAPGTLRMAPTVISGPDGNATLLLVVAESVGDCSLWLVRLGEATTTTPQIERIRLGGWLWFTPVNDPERLAAITDRGVLGLFGLRRPGAFDPPVYPLLDKETVNVTNDGLTQRALIAHADELGLTILAGGRLRQWLLGIDRGLGRQVKPGWTVPAPLGTPLSGVWNDDNGSIVLTTRRSESSLTLATAVRTDTGAVLWQRPLGFAPTSHYQIIGEQLVSVDPRGAIVAMPVGGELSSLPNGWRVGGRELAGPVAGFNGEPVFVQGTEHLTTVLQLGNGILFRRVNSDLSVSDKKFDLPSPLLGQAGIDANAAILPLQNGQLVRISLTDSGARPVPGPTWRATGVGADVAGRVTHWHDQTFLVFDGSRRLMTLQWSAPTVFQLGTSTALERSRRLIGSPAVLQGTPPRAVVADAGGSVLLLRGDQLEIERTWRVADDRHSVTHGPKVIGNRIVLIVENRELICLDPASTKPLWAIRSPGDGLVNLPVALDSEWVVADRDGRFWLLDPTTGQLRNTNGYRLSSTLAAAGPMLAIGGDRLLVFLTDGSAIVLTRDELSK